MELNIEQKEYIPALSPDAGIRVLIHKRGTYPFPEDDGFSIPPGHMTSVALEVVSFLYISLYVDNVFFYQYRSVFAY